MDEDDLQTPVMFWSNDATNSDDRPKICITYRDMTGIESYWSYSSQSAGLAGTGYINRANGILTWTKGLLSTTDSLMPFTPTLVYSSALSGKSFTSDNTLTCLTNSYLPYGFKWNMQETIVQRTFTNEDNVSEAYYIWSDADGTEHAFFAKNGVYEDDDGLQLTMDVTSNPGDIIMQDDSVTIRRFSRLVVNNVLQGWYLTSIEDSNGNILTFAYDGQRIAAIKLIPVVYDPNIQMEEHTITFLEIEYTQDSLLPCFIWNPVAKEAVVFRYSATPTGNFVTTGGHYLRELVYVYQGENQNMTVDALRAFYQSASNTTNISVSGKAVYTYGNYKQLQRCQDDLSGYAVAYTYYYSSLRVTAVSEYGSDNSLGQQIKFAYYTGYTEVTTTGSDDELNTEDDLITRYIFDNAGRVVNGYSTDKNKTQIYGAFSGTYEDRSERAKNSIKESASIGGIAANYLLNGGFELGQDYWVFSTHASVSVANHMEGFGYATIAVSGETEESISQYVQLPVGTYTLSALFDTRECMNASISFVAESLNDTNHKITKIVPCNANEAIQWEQQAAMTFTAGSYNGNGTEKFKISILVAGTSSLTDTPIVRVDTVVIEKNIGNSPYNIVQCGNFESCTLSANGTPINAISSFWQGNYTVITETEPFVSVAKITGNISAKKEFKQTFHIASPQDLYEFNNNNIHSDSLSAKTYIVSGFGKAANFVKNGNSTFGLRIDINYYQGYINGEHTHQTVSVSFAFQTDCPDWQFVCGTFTSEEGQLIDTIDIYCEFSYQPNNFYAYFDNISLVESTDGSVLRNSYYYYDPEHNTNDFENNAILDGLVHVQRSGSVFEIYEYYTAPGSDTNPNSPRQLQYKANNRGELWEYNYQRGIQLLTETLYYYLPASSTPLFFDLPFNSQINKTIKTRTFYAYNSFGQRTFSSTSEVEIITEEGIPMVIPVINARPIITINAYEMNTDSRIVGALLQTTDSLERSIRYFYDSTTGRLLATVNVDGDTGTCYTYDAIGNLTSAMPAAYSTDTAYTFETNTEKVNYTYNAHNQLSTISTDTTTYSFTYDAFGNTDSVAVGNQTLAEYTYNDYNGKRTEVVYGNGHAMRYVYDEVDNVKAIWYSSNSGATWQKAYEYTYTAYGQLYQFDNLLTGRSMMYQYDTAGKLLDMVEFDTDSGYNLLSVRRVYNKEGLLNNYNYCVEYLATGDTVTAGYIYNYYTYDSHGILNSQSVFTPATSGEITLTYDIYHRLSSKTVDMHIMGDTSTRFINNVEYRYTVTSHYRTSNQVSEYINQINGVTTAYTYTYDDNGNITEIHNGNTLLFSYEYDNLGQLTRENNQPLGKTWVYEYDNAGNRQSKKTYAYTTGALGTVQSTVNYNYNNANWGDLLTSVGGVSITYDAIGNPLTIGSKTLTWQGRRLMSYTVGGDTVTYAYNDDGIRVSQNVAGTIHEYMLDGSRIIGEIVKNASGVEQYRLTYLYDDLDGSPVGMQYRSPSMTQDTWYAYWFEKNLQGDIVAVYYQDGTKIASYTYDAWGNCTQTTHQSAGVYAYAQYNPFRYRSYYYDTTTGYYYLQSRYYNPEWGRFLNADIYLNANGDLLGYNLFAYCSNNPVMGYDPEGTWNWDKFFSGADLLVVGITAVAVAATVFSCGTAAPLMLAIASVTLVTGAATAIMGVAEIIEAGTDYNIVRDTVFGGDEDAYGTFKSVTKLTAEVGTLICGTYYAVHGGNVCFVEGTPVQAESGAVPIETIAAGMLVWANDPETGRTELKPVVQIFRNQATELVHVTINGEEIICTNEHPFYSPVKGWIAACQLRAGDILVMLNGAYAIVEQVQHELLESPIATYNFEVADFHTYYVGDTSVLVHNSCGPEAPSKLNKSALKDIDVHKFKNDMNVGSNMDIFKDKAANGLLWLGNKAQNIWINTGYYLGDLLNIYPK